MVELTEMWAELEKYQPYADRRGFGYEWCRMMTERTTEAALAAYMAARGRLAAGEKTSWHAKSASNLVRHVLRASREAVAVEAAELAIKRIRKAIEIEKSDD